MKLIIIALLSMNYLHATYWPDPNWEKVDLHTAGFKQEKFIEFTNYVFNKNELFKTDGLVIIKNGRLVYEKYANQYHAKTKHLVWSVSKSITSALFGIAEKKKLLNKNQHAYKYYEELNHGEAKKITIHHLLQMSSGLKWNEGYEGNPLRSDVVRMLYTGKFDDMATYTATRKLKYSPGTYFYYSSGETNLLMGILKKSMTTNEYNQFPWKELFHKIGIFNASWEKDQSGTFVGSSYAYMPPRDLAKFGLLYLRKGKWKSEQILPKGWVDYSVEVTPAFLQTELEGLDNRESYGAQWWLNKDLPKKGVKRPYPDAPDDTYMALGHHGQSLIIIPSLDLIIVRTALDRKGPIDRNKMLKLLISSLKKEKSI